MQNSSSRPANRGLPWLAAGLGGTCLLIACCAGLAGLVPLAARWAQAAGLTESGPGSGSGPGAPTGSRVGEFAPDFTLEQVAGGEVSLSRFRGQPVLVNFWATWCGFCVAEMPLIQANYLEHADRLVVLAIDEGEAPAAVSDFVRQEGYTFPVLLDPARSAGRLYRVNAYPISYFIDVDGIIRYIVEGRMSESEMKTGLLAIGIGK